MTTTYSYCATTLEHVRFLLKNFQDQGRPKDYEIRVDGATSVARTKDLGRFNLFKNSLTQFTQTVSVLFYKGRSRRYDKYDLRIDTNHPKDSSLATIEYIETEVENRIREQEKQIKFSTQKEKIKHLKKENKRLRTRNAELEAKQSNDIKEIISMVATQIPMFNAGTELSGTLNGVPMSDLIKLVNDRRKKWGDETFSRVIGVTMTLGDNLHLLEETEAIIKASMDSKNETNEE